MAPSERTDKANTSWSTHDNACGHCRERKIRCGRERPRCANCKRDGVGCEYSTPGKRVNHIKLLCNNVGGLEDRLSNIEADLSFMTKFLKTNGNQKLFPNMAIEDDNPGEFPTDDILGEDDLSLPQTDRHIVRSSSNLTDRYHGPCTLLALCNEFSDTLLSAQQAQSPTSTSRDSTSSNTPVINDAAKGLLDLIRLEASTEDSIDLQADPIPIRLPPKQFLLMAQTQFFQQVDYATDIFVQAHFWSNVERVYSRPFTSADEAWAICFNTIILLVLGPDSSSQDCDSMIGSQFVRPFLLTVRSALSNPRILMAAKIVNVQALALLSIAAQKYYPFGFAESISAQACVLARTMGLHQANSAQEGVSSEEAIERVKVFGSLYLRDKSCSISRGSICWLPSFDCSLISELANNGPGDSRYAIRFQLAKLEDETYRLFHSADSPRPSSPKYKSAVLRIEQGLESWANTHEVFSPACESRNVHLQLEFLAARICVLRKSSEPSQIKRAIDDTRASCLLVVISYGKHDSSMVEQLHTLLSSKSPSRAAGKKKTSTRSSKSGKSSPNRSENSNPNEPVSPRFHSLLDTFSVPGFFLLAKNVIWPSSAYDESIPEDLNLLQRTCACYKELDARTQASNHTRKVGRAFESLLEVINVVKNAQQPQQTQVTQYGMPQQNNSHNISSINNPFGEQQPFSSLPSPPGSSVPPISWDSFLNKSNSMTASDSPNGSSSPALLTPIDSHNQSHESLRQNFFFSQSQQQQQQQQAMQAPSFGQPLTNESDVSMDDFADSRLLSEFLTANPSMSY